MRRNTDSDWFSGCNQNDPWGDAHSSWRDPEQARGRNERRESSFDGQQKEPPEQPEAPEETTTKNNGQEQSGLYFRKDPGGTFQGSLRNVKHQRKKWPVIVLICFLLSFGLGLVASTGNVLESVSTPENWDWAWEDGDSDGTGDWDVERADDADENYSIAPFEGDSSGLTLQLQDHEGKKAMELPQLYEACLPTTVSITVYAEDSAAYGSGVVLTSDGYILTCAHVIDNMESAVVTTSDGETYDALMVGIDNQTDLAVLKIQAEGLQSAEFGDSTGLKIGETVCAIGDSLGIQFRSSLSDGIVSGLNREVSSNSYSMVLIQTTAAVNSGNSGGALFNSYGQVIGIVNMKMSSNMGAASIDNMGLAIPSATVKDVVESLADNGSISRAVLGISCYGINATSSKINGIPEGLWVTEIQEVSDCDDAGVLEGDIITAVNGQEINSVAQCKQVIGGLGVGDIVTLTIWRDEALVQRMQEAKEEDSEDDHILEDDQVIQYNFEYYGDINVMLVSSDDVNQ